MSKAAEVFKAAWEARHEEWLEETQGDDNFGPTSESFRTEAGLDAVTEWLLGEAIAVPDGSPIDEPLTGMAYAQGILWATRMMRGLEELA